MLEENPRLVAADRGGHKPDRRLRASRLLGDIQAWDCQRPVLHGLGMLRPETEAAPVRPADHQLSCPGPRSGMASSESRSPSGPSSRRRSPENMISATGSNPANDAPIATPRIAGSEIGVSLTRSFRTPQEARRDLEHAAGRPDVLAQEDHRRVATQLPRDPLGHRLPVRDHFRLVGHVRHAEPPSAHMSVIASAGSAGPAAGRPHPGVGRPQPTSSGRSTLNSANSCLDAGLRSRSAPGVPALVPSTMASKASAAAVSRPGRAR